MTYKIIKEGEAGVVWQSGRVVKTVGPGVHGYATLFGRSITRVNLLDTDYLCAAQEYTTKDYVAVRFFIRVKIAVSKPALLLKKIKYDDLSDCIQNTVSDAARSIVLSKKLDEILEEAGTFSDQIGAAVRGGFDEMGLKLVSVSPVSILIPRSLKQAYEAEMAAKKRTIADLEEARGRTATLRHLANAADMVEKRPMLLQLLLGQKARNVQFQFDGKDKK